MKKQKRIILGILAVLVLLFGLGTLKIQSVKSYQSGQMQEVATVEETPSGNLTPSEPPAVSGSAVLPEETGEPEKESLDKSEPDNKKTGKVSAEKDKKESSEPAVKPKETAKRGKAKKTGATPEPAKKQDTASNKNEAAATTAPVPQEREETAPAATEQPSQEEVIYCTIEIRCGRLVENKKAVKQELWQYIPDDGIVLARTQVGVKKESTVYDVLSGVCREKNIALDAEYTPLYKNYYVRGIAYLYEKIAGDMSGWLYKVNGKKPNVGASGFKVSEGDEIVWSYTCDGKTS